ncbi:unnamed protein product [Lathyrus oleraceus]|uniref:uncharacterized protein LOC127087674 n=1 Tax=Pisum sativum TaxID=3888 RepID=UPI0021CEA3B3|nr:uncharacterized protein LOC127087674 [Pisum sativum]
MVIMYPLLQHHVMFRNTCCMKQNQQRQYASLRSNEKQQQRQYASAAARDRVIDFGKYKGKMLGSLPSSYLKWVSKNLRARDFEKWAILADQVLVDPIYKDRIEWEFALNVLERNRSGEPAVSQLQDISDRFGWDYLDKLGWSKVDFDLLGTSNGGRIPRVDNRRDADADASQPSLPPATTSNNRPNLRPATTSRRMERREKLKMRSRTTHEEEEEEAQQQHKDKDDTVPAADIKQIANPFPGRQALLRKAINYRAQS